MTETLPLHGRFTGIDLDQLVDWRVVRTWLYLGMFWLMVTPSIGVALSGLFNYPDYLDRFMLVRILLLHRDLSIHFASRNVPKHCARLPPEFTIFPFNFGNARN